MTRNLKADVLLFLRSLTTFRATLLNALGNNRMKGVYWFTLILFASSSAWAQTAALRGLVTDQNGAVVAGAKVTVNGPSGLSKTTNSDKTGSYSFTGLPPGDYEVRATAPSLRCSSRGHG